MHAGGGQRVGTWWWDTTACHIQGYEAALDLLGWGEAWESPSLGYNAAGCRRLGKGRACRTASMSPGTVGRVKGTSTVYLMSQGASKA